MNTENNDNLICIKGEVEKTLKIDENLPTKISLLRLDTDWYESTKIELEVLFPLLSKNGILIIDDYGYWKGSKKAVDEYIVDGKLKIVEKIGHYKNAYYPTTQNKVLRDREGVICQVV